MESYVVIGGGLAGLTAANALAMQSGKVTLLEQSAHLGGRARTHRENGYSFNLGPHALYRAGHAARTFKDWNIRYSGALPATSSSGYFVRGDRLFPMFKNLSGLLTTRMFNLREKLEVANLLRLFAAADAKHSDSKPHESMSRWLDRHTSLPRVRELAATLIRVSTFAIDLDHLSAALALTQLASALKHSVLYLDGGWQTLVDGLAERARSLGVEIRCGEPVASLESIDATGIVLAAGPEAVGKLTGAPLPAGHPIRMAALDLSLSGMPVDTPKVAFATDRPLYLSDHSASAKVAPEGKKLIHVAKYLGDSAPNPKTLRAELEDYATLVMPSWPQHAEAVRFLPDLTVTSFMPETGGRPNTDFLRNGRITIAGDWVGPEGMLADAAVSSGLAAAQALHQRRAAAA